MSAYAASRAGDAPAARSTVRGSLALRAVAFFALFVYASLQYASLLHAPPRGSVVLVVAVAATMGVAVAAAGGERGPAWTSKVTRTILLLIALALALLAAGVPAHALVPWRVAAFVHGLKYGAEGLTRWVWPYSGGRTWTRIAVLVVLVPANLLAAALYFWPTRRVGALRLGGCVAIAVLLVLAGAANSPSGAWRVQGALLALLLFGLLWLPTVGGLDGARATVWLGACLIAALLVAPALRTTAWLQLTGGLGGSGSLSFEWDQLYGPTDWPHSTRTVMTFSGGAGDLVRVTSLDRFDGLRFIRSDSPPSTVRLEAALARRHPAWVKSARFTIAGLKTSLLAGLPGGNAGVGLKLGEREPTVATDGTLEFDETLPQGARYTVRAYAPSPTVTQLRRAPHAVPRALVPYTRFDLPALDASAFVAPDLAAEAGARRAERAIALPWDLRPTSATLASVRAVESSVYARTFALARSLAAGGRSPYGVALRIERYLRTGYAYTEDPPLRRYPLIAFLFRDKRGYCEQFSGAMTLLLRMDGIPARVGVGFKPSLYDAPRREWIVRGVDAHAWVEVFFTGIGWVTFDPTPLGARGAAAGLGVSKAALLRRTHHTGRGATLTGSAHATAGGSGAASVAARALAGLALALLAAFALAWIRGARRIRLALAGNGTLALAELTDAVAAANLGTGQHTTLEVIAHRMDASGDAAAAAYVRLLRDLRFAAPDARKVTAFGDALGKRAALRRALCRGAGARTRLAVLLRMPPGAMWKRG
ncbi:MAG TPA: transglutaminase-like domain-containing protein [Solirubrobacteraceae bacterium]|nr:transglutaminase-like domain-containing protein [Solirubrobacteraceae bacterium]